MANRRFKWSMILLALVVLTLVIGVARADEADAQEMKAYWDIVSQGHQSETLALAMDGSYDELTLEALKAITKEELLTFAAVYKLPVSMARHAWYTALADMLAANIPATATGERLALFLAMKSEPRDKAANEQRRTIRKAVTEAEIHACAEETGLPAGFLCWLLLDDEWYEADWDDGDDWLDGRRSWNIPDWVDAGDLLEACGRDAVITEEDVEQTLRRNGLHFDD